MDGADQIFAHAATTSTAYTKWSSGDAILVWAASAAGRQPPAAGFALMAAVVAASLITGRD